MPLTRSDLTEMLYREGEKRCLHRLWRWEGLIREEREFFIYVARKVGLVSDEAEESEKETGQESGRSSSI